MKQANIISAKALVKNFLNNLEKLSNFKENPNSNNGISIFDSWDKIIGNKNLADHCELSNIENQTAVITVNHQGWSQQILLNKKKILYNFNHLYPELNIKNISIIVSNNIKILKAESSKNNLFEQKTQLNTPIIKEPIECKEVNKYPELASALKSLKKSILNNK